jgi:hypothetical protein
MPVAPTEAAVPLVTTTLVVDAAAAGDPHTGLVGEPVAEAIAEAEAAQTATSLVSRATATMPTA